MELHFEGGLKEPERPADAPGVGKIFNHFYTEVLVLCAAEALKLELMLSARHFKAKSLQGTCRMWTSATSDSCPQSCRCRFSNGSGDGPSCVIAQAVRYHQVVQMVRETRIPHQRSCFDIDMPLHMCVVVLSPRVLQTRHCCSIGTRFWHPSGAGFWPSCGGI
mmetsp:Transcript_88398/g.283562  ORF Transcript_88398/g.283562 Transcript_88398/m.283562 type:complete len:163 (-) Transcript_88398:617-1105(-)